MNQRHRDLLQQLEQATSNSPEFPADEETAQLRESWLGLVRLLEAADGGSPGFDRPVLPTSHPLPRRGMWLGAAALAATLLLALSAIWLTLRTPIDVALPPLPENDGRTPPVAVAFRGSDTAWDDQLDEQLVEAGAALQLLQQDWEYDEGAFQVLDHQLRALEQEMQSETL